MIIYVKDRSVKVPRKRKRKWIAINSTQIYRPPPYRAPDHSDIPSAMNELFKLGLEKEQRLEKERNNACQRYIYNKVRSG